MRAVVLIILAALALGGCADDDVERALDDARDRVGRAVSDVEDGIREARADAERVGRRIEQRVRETLEELEQAVPAAGPGSRPPRARSTEASEMSRYLTKVLRSVDEYWTRTLEASGAEEPVVSFAWIPPGDRAASACGQDADDRAAFYCPADDTIYVGETIAAEVYDGIARGLPGQEAGQGRAVGDFGVAYIVAHEYAHNLQQEFGFFAGATGAAKPFELQADCFAGLWGNSVYRAGQLQPDDVEEAVSTAGAVGDFETSSAQHHGTPDERRDAWLLGFRSGDPTVCRHFVVS